MFFHFSLLQQLIAIFLSEYAAGLTPFTLGSNLYTTSNGKRFKIHSRDNSLASMLNSIEDDIARTSDADTDTDSYLTFNPSALRIKQVETEIAKNSDTDSDSFMRFSSVGTPFQKKVDATGAKSVDSKANSTAVKNVSRKHQGKYGATRHLKQIFLGRCYEYQYRKGIIEENEWNCDKLWDLFFHAFAYKGPCDVTSYDYNAFLDAIDEKVGVDKGLLWSGTRELAHKYSDFLFTGKYTTLEDTLAGYLLNGMTWCGHPKYGINFHECPWSCSLQSPYWSLANTRFAQKLRGLVHIVLNGTRMHMNDGRKYPAYMKDRYYLGPNVIPVLNKGNIKEVIIVVAHTFHVPPLESCGMKSVKVLENEIAKKGIPVKCYNDPDSTKHVLCAADPRAKECASVKTSSVVYSKSSKYTIASRNETGGLAGINSLK